ncbi:MAG: RecX family transcriptional regulator [Clostridia bacterium]
MEITTLEIQKRNKQRVNLYLDNEFKCGLTAITVLSRRLKVGDQLSQEELDDILQTSETDIAFSKAIDYISRSLKTQKQATDYLLDKGFAQVVVDNVITKLKYYKYINDFDYARTYVEQAKNSIGDRKMKAELTQRGVDETIIEQFLCEIDPQTYKQSCLVQANKYLKNKQLDNKTLQGLYRYLLYRGFDYEQINTTISSLKEEE